ncbi:hypothetical protein RJ639_041533 [Escallonia herrerae]|uniref:GAG-pre-integrase domain-containing protein n=1 Tax=Escallonia herrerae TaxID=1293975 RepID=A0AA89BBK4_9ASTE|nr:hypothetical protein RJ639_041533 [Escallonia herrerae]
MIVASFFFLLHHQQTHTQALADERHHARIGVQDAFPFGLMDLFATAQTWWVLIGDEVRQGSTITGATATTSSFDIDYDTTKLCYMHFGHISERGVDVLSKQGLLGSKKTGKLDFYEHCVFEKQCRKEELIDARKDHGVRGKVELEVQAPDSLPIIPIDEDDGSHSTEENEEQQDNIVRNRPRREIRPPQKYGYVDMVAYALSVAEDIEVEEPVTYKEAIKSTKSA